MARKVPAWYLDAMDRATEQFTAEFGRLIDEAVGVPKRAVPILTKDDGTVWDVTSIGDDDARP